MEWKTRRFGLVHGHASTVVSEEDLLNSADVGGCSDIIAKVVALSVVHDVLQQKNIEGTLARVYA